MKNILFVFVISFTLISVISCKKKPDTRQHSESQTFVVNPAYEKPYIPQGITPVSNLNVETSVYIYIQHLKEQLEWNKRITYMIKKKQHENRSSAGNTAGTTRSSDNPQINESSQGMNAGDYGALFNDYKQRYEKIFFDTIGVYRDKWEEFSTKFFKEILEYRQKKPEIEAEITKYSRLIQEQQSMINNE